MAEQFDTSNNSRFGIKVPSPEARLNMGKPEAGKSPFGYAVPVAPMSRCNIISFAQRTASSNRDCFLTYR